VKFLPLVWAGLWRKRARTIFTLLSIVTAFLLFGMLQGVISAFDKSVEAAAVDRLTVVSKVSFTEPLPYGYLAQIESVPGVKGVAYESWFGSYYQDPKNFVFSFPVDPERYFPLVPEVKIPAEQLQTMIRTRTGAIIGKDLAEKYGWKIGDRVPLNSQIWTKADGSSNWEFDIVGIFEAPSVNNLASIFYFNHSYFDEARSFGKGKVGWYVVRLKDPNQAPQVARAIDALFENSPDETKTQTEKEFQQSFLKQQGDIQFIVRSILGAVFFTLLFLTGNTMMQSVRERIPELAVLKTLGFSDGGVLMLVLAESLLLCLFAAAIGLALASMMFPALKAFMGEVTLPGSVLAMGALVATLLALITGLPPALRAKRLNIVDALAGR
jgi:putative ABC transport system permease protein